MKRISAMTLSDKLLLNLVQPTSPFLWNRSVVGFQSQQGNLGWATEAERRKNRTDSDGDKNLGVRGLGQSRRIVSTPFGNEWPAQKGKVDLPSMGMAAQDKLNTGIFEKIGEMRIMGEGKDGRPVGRALERRLRIGMAEREIIQSAEPDARPSALDPAAFIGQFANSVACEFLGNKHPVDADIPVALNGKNP